MENRRWQRIDPVMPTDPTPEQEALAEALESTILTSPDKYMDDAYRTLYSDLEPSQQRHVQRDAAALIAALAEHGYRVSKEPTTDPLNAMVAVAGERVKAEHAARYADLWACVEIADQKAEQDFDSKTVEVPVTDWNRIVAVARGHMSKPARAAIERFRDRSFEAAQLSQAGKKP